MSSQTEIATNNRSSKKEHSKKIPTGDVESEKSSPFPTDRNSVSTTNSYFNSNPELPMNAETNSAVAPSQVEENNSQSSVVKQKRAYNKRGKTKQAEPSKLLPFAQVDVVVSQSIEDEIADDERKPSGDDELVDTGCLEDASGQIDFGVGAELEAETFDEEVEGSAQEPYEEPNEELCVICQEPLGEMKTMNGDNCNHKFHCGECWSGLIARRNNCPLCNGILIAEGWRREVSNSPYWDLPQAEVQPVQTAEEIELAAFEEEERALAEQIRLAEIAREERRRQLQERAEASRLINEVAAIRQRKILALNLRKQQEAERRRLQDIAFAQEEQDIMAMTDEALVQEEINSRAVIALRDAPVPTRARTPARTRAPSAPRSRQVRQVVPTVANTPVAPITSPTQARGRGGNGDRSRPRTTVNMDIRIGDILVMTLNGISWRVVCRDATGFGSFEVLEAPGRPDIVGQSFSNGSPINAIFQDFVVSVGLRRQSRAPWGTYTKKWRNGVNLGGLNWV